MTKILYYSRYGKCAFWRLCCQHIYLCVIVFHVRRLQLSNFRKWSRFTDGIFKFEYGNNYQTRALHPEGLLFIFFREMALTVWHHWACGEVTRKIPSSYQCILPRPHCGVTAGVPGPDSLPRPVLLGYPHQQSARESHQLSYNTKPR